jgi:hypothetical protein
VNFAIKLLLSIVLPIQLFFAGTATTPFTVQTSLSLATSVTFSAQNVTVSLEIVSPGLHSTIDSDQLAALACRKIIPMMLILNLLHLSSLASRNRGREKLKG